MTKEKNIKNNKSFLIRTIIFLLIIAALCCTLLFKDKVEGFINSKLNEQPLSTIIDENGMIVHFIDVDQADAILVEFPTGEIMLIDSGDNNTESQDKLTNYLSTIDFEIEDEEKVIDYFVLTHPHADHIGGAITIFENYLVKSCYLPQIYSKNEDVTSIPNAVQCYSDIYANTIIAIDNEGCDKIWATQELQIKTNNYDESTALTDKTMWIIDFLAPVSGENYIENGTPNTATPNNYSPIMILSYMNKRIMFTGDAEKAVEDDVLDAYAENLDFLDVDILKVAHHGGNTSTTTEFLNAVKPEYAIIPVGIDNSYNHPSDKTLTRLADYGMNNNNIYRTDLNGNIAVGISESGELSLEANHVQYSTIEIKLWYIILGGTVLFAIIIYAPYIAKVKKLTAQTEKKVKMITKTTTKNRKK